MWHREVWWLRIEASEKSAATIIRASEWRTRFPPKIRYIPTRIHGVTFQKTPTFSAAAPPPPKVASRLKMGRSIPRLPPLWLHGKLKGDLAYNFISFLRAVCSAHNSWYANRIEVYQSFSDEFCCSQFGRNEVSIRTSLVCFGSQLTSWHYGSYRQLVAVFRRAIKSSQGLCLHTELHTWKSHERISVSIYPEYPPVYRR